MRKRFPGDRHLLLSVTHNAFLTFGLFSLCLVSLFSHCQTGADTLQQLLINASTDAEKCRLLARLSQTYVMVNTDSALHYSYQQLLLADKRKLTNHQVDARTTIAWLLGQTGNYVKGVDMVLKAKDIATQANDTSSLAASYQLLGHVYRWQKDFPNALANYRQSYALSNPNENHYTREMNLGNVYYELDNLDTALYYGQKAYASVLQSTMPRSKYAVLYILGKIHQKLGNERLAREYFSLAETAVKGTKNVRGKAEVHLELSRFFLRKGDTDSSVHFAKEAILVPGIDAFKPQVLEAAELLAELYSEKNTDSSFKYLLLSSRMQKELLGIEKAQQMQAMQFEAKLREQEYTMQKLAEEEDRKHNLQYAAIALGLVTLLIVFFLLSHSVLAGQRLIRFLGILALLIVFEFFNLLLHPYIASLTHHSPLYMLLIMVCVAALLIPLHHRLEQRVTKKMIEKNNKIRLAAAKRTIKQLEGESTVIVEDAASKERHEKQS